jgi:hypothetical protein
VPRGIEVSECADVTSAELAALGLVERRLLLWWRGLLAGLLGHPS